MLDLKAIFDPDAATQAPRWMGVEVASPSFGPDDLPGDWRVEWEERAAIMEYDGGLPREHAEAEALTDVLRRMKIDGH